MKKIVSLIAAVAALALSANAGQYQLINGTAYTNATVVVGSNTNQIGVVLAASTNFYNMPVMSSSSSSSSTGLLPSNQANTNAWPSVGFSVVGYPNTFYGPSSVVLINNNIALTATNATSTALVVKYAGYDGYLWVSNVLSTTVTVAVNTTTASTSTNFTSGAWQALALQQIENPGATGAITNHISDAADKPGL